MQFPEKKFSCNYIQCRVITTRKMANLLRHKIPQRFVIIFDPFLSEAKIGNISTIAPIRRTGFGTPNPCFDRLRLLRLFSSAVTPLPIAKYQVNCAHIEDETERKREFDARLSKCFTACYHTTIYGTQWDCCESPVRFSYLTTALQLSTDYNP
ncbi:hypothetical protein T09_7939 [Trichinella sp. T9]|nr:hypothetical protein T09_7939 [Trichinella sp. T9]